MIHANMVPLYECDICGHSWTARRVGETEPKRCAGCKSPAWNRAKRPAGRPARATPTRAASVTVPIYMSESHTLTDELDAWRRTRKPLPKPSAKPKPKARQ